MDRQAAAPHFNERCRQIRCHPHPTNAGVASYFSCRLTMQSPANENCSSPLPGINSWTMITLESTIVHASSYAVSSDLRSWSRQALAAVKRLRLDLKAGFKITGKVQLRSATSSLFAGLHVHG